VATVPLTANTGQQVIKDGVNGGRINPLLETVEFTIESPQVRMATCDSQLPGVLVRHTT
jgi:hypothetical protein